MMGGVVKEHITTLNVYAPINRTSKYTKQNLIASHEKGQPTILVRDFSILHLTMDSTSRHGAHTLMFRLFLSPK